MDCAIVPYGHGLYDLLEIKKSHSQKKKKKEKKPLKIVLVAWFPVQTLGL